MSKEEIIEKLLENCEADYSDPKYRNVNSANDAVVWTLCDLFVRQWLNNGADGFGMINVEKMYELLVDNLDVLIENDMLNEDGYNNFGFPLWSEYQIYPIHPLFGFGCSLSFKRGA